MPPLFEAMADAYPKVRTVVVDATTTSLLPQVHGGQLELAVVALPIHDPELTAEPLFEEDLLLIAPTGHPLAACDRVTLDELARHDLLLEPPGTAFRDDLDAQARQAGVTLSTKAEVDGMRLVASLALDGFGAAVLPASAAPRDLQPNAKVVTIEGVAGRTVGLARRRRSQLSAPSRAVVEVISEIVAAAGDRPGSDRSSSQRQRERDGDAMGWGTLMGVLAT